ncbi:SDR family oxidoreductase [Aquihabitans sp. McL0605]|uniref:SDR family oxidoreductase n=1 Tax=Aquihabitans sp. McL0605 TaxID=3415671 RepID=UPI003CF28810
MDQFTSVVTGANTGLGRATAQALAARGDRVIFACRTEAKAREAMDAVAAATGSDQLEFLALDLADLDQVRSAAGTLLERGDPIHLLVANAGIAAQRGTTAQGFELAFGVNHLGHFLFVSELLPLLEAGSPAPDGAPARVVVVSSGSHYAAKKGIDFEAVRQPTASFSGMPEYGVSKLANVLFVQELCRRTDPADLFAVALHPGNLIGTDVMRRVPKPLESLVKRFRPSAEVGAKTSVLCATSAEVLDHRGEYYSVLKLKDPAKVATPELGAELWRRSEEWTAPGA